jgi:N-acetylneuraminic acid mutarotase
MFNTLKKASLALLVTSTAFLQISCNDDVDPDKLGNWYKSEIPQFGGSKRMGAVSFTIGTKGYIGTGLTNESVPRVKDFWAYEPSTHIWSQPAEFAGTGRNNAVSFVLNGKAYVGTGFDGNSNTDLAYKKDFWQYDPTTNSWKEVAEFPGATRQYATSFVVANKAYVGLGVNQSNYFQDVYSYNDANDSWESVATFIGGKRRGATSFVIDNVAYVGFGTNNSTAKTKDLYKFDPTAGTWSKISYVEEDNLTVRTNSMSYVVNGKAIIVGGEGLSDVWEFNPSTTEWTQLNPFIGGARGYAAGFVMNNIIYFGTGSAGSSYTDDFYAFDPSAALDDDDDN